MRSYNLHTVCLVIMNEPVYRTMASLKVVWSLIECRWSGHTQSGLVSSGDSVCPNGLLMLIIVKVMKTYELRQTQSKNHALLPPHPRSVP